MGSETHKAATTDDAPRLTAEEAALASRLIGESGVGNGISDDGKDALVKKLGSIAEFNA